MALEFIMRSNLGGVWFYRVQQAGLYSLEAVAIERNYFLPVFVGHNKILTALVETKKTNTKSPTRITSISQKSPLFTFTTIL